MLDPRQFGPAAVAEADASARQATSRRRRAASPWPGRHRIEVRIGMWRKRRQRRDDHRPASIELDPFGGFGYTRLRPRGSRDDVQRRTRSASSRAPASGPNGVVAGTSAARGAVGIRWNPLKGDHGSQSLKPFLAVGARSGHRLQLGQLHRRTTRSPRATRRARRSAATSAAASTSTWRGRSRSA